jgi:serine/threonine protein kinase
MLIQASVLRVLHVFAGYTPFSVVGEMDANAKTDAIYANITAFKAPLHFPPLLSVVASDLIRSLVDNNPSNRVSASQLINHDWLNKPTSSTS